MGPIAKELYRTCEKGVLGTMIDRDGRKMPI
jgi:hypothetical protein